MTPTTDSRKRSRDDNDDLISDLNPSKRFNNTNFEQNEQIIQQQINNLNISSNHSHNGYNNGHHHQQHYEPPRYSPHLTMAENPHYFNRNRLLYDLHMEKLKRGGT